MRELRRAYAVSSDIKRALVIAYDVAARSDIKTEERSDGKVLVRTNASEKTFAALLRRAACIKYRHDTGLTAIPAESEKARLHAVWLRLTSWTALPKTSLEEFEIVE